MSAEPIDKIEMMQSVLQSLKPNELEAFQKWQISKQAHLSTDTQARLYLLFLNGRSCEEIRTQNTGFSLGQVVAARILGEWDRRLAEHLDSLLSNTTERYKQVSLESVNFVADLIAATNKQNSEKINAYFKSGDPNDLGSLQILSLKGYKEAIELFQKLTGQDKVQKVNGDLTITHKGNSGNATLTSEDAADILKQLLGKNK